MTDQDQKQLGKTLWNIADQLRGAMNADDFRDYMLSFLFLRYLSDNYGMAAKKELGRDYPDPNAIGNGGRSPLSVWYAQNPDEAGFFSAAMGNLSALAAEELVRVYDFSAARKVADVGGAHGVLLTTILRANPTTRGILFDLPHVIATAG